jgi:hypothetical protein
MAIQWLRLGDTWQAVDTENPNSPGNDVIAPGAVPYATVQNGQTIFTPQARQSTWVFDPTTGTFKTNLNPTPYASTPTTYGTGTVVAGAQQATAAANLLGAANTDIYNRQIQTGYIPSYTLPGWENQMYASGQWRRVPNPDGYGFRVYRADGSYVGQYSGLGGGNDQFRPDGSYIAGAPPLQDMAFLQTQAGGGGIPTISKQQADALAQYYRDQVAQQRYATDTNAATTREGYQNQYNIANLNAQNAREIAQLNNQNAIQLENLRGSNAIQLANLNNASAREIAQLNNQTQMQIAQLQDATRRLESDRQYYIQTGQLDLARLAEQHQHEIALQQQKLEEQKFALDVIERRAELAANPFNAFKNALFVNAIEDNPLFARYGTPNPQSLDALLPPEKSGPNSSAVLYDIGPPAPVGATHGIQPPNQAETAPSVAAIANLPIFQRMKATGGRTIAGAFNTPVAAGGAQANLRTFSNAAPSDQELYLSGVRSSGQYLPDFVRAMQRSAPTGSFSGLAKYG